MPYKRSRGKSKRPKTKKTLYRVKNWPEYTPALKKRGSLTVYLSPDLEETWYEKKPCIYKQGHPVSYSDHAITTMLALRMLFKLPLRQTEGFFESLFELAGINLNVPDYTRLSRRGSTPLKQLSLPDAKEPCHLIVDSTGLKVYGESEWLETKHGKSYQRKLWRKLHIGVVEEGLILSRKMTDHLTDDRQCLISLIEQAGDQVTEVIADPGYDGNNIYNLLAERGIKAIIPSRQDAKVTLQDDPTLKDQAIAYIEKKGYYAWQNKNQYGRRARVENTFYRYKTIISRSLKSRLWENQDAETHLGCCLLNQMTKLGMPHSVKVS